MNRLPMTESSPADRQGDHAEPTQSTGRAVWWEVLAVLVIVPFPWLWLKLGPLVLPPAQPDTTPYWFSLLNRSFYFALSTYLTIYVISRSGENWGKFGLVEPRWRHLWLGLLLFIAVEPLDWICGRLFPSEGYTGLGAAVPRSQGVLESVLLFVTVLQGAFLEELVFRAYLVIRLETLLNSAGWAVVCAALLFGASHSGMRGMVETALVGLLYGAVYLKVRQISPFVLGHALHNALLILRGATY